MMLRFLCLMAAGVNLAACSPKANSADNSIPTASFDKEGVASNRNDAVDDDDRGATKEPANPAATDSAGAARQPFVAMFVSSVPVPNALRPGIVRLAENCIVVKLSDASEEFTAVFPPGTSLRMNGGRPVSIDFEGGSLPLGVPTRIPGGRVSEGALARPLDPSCPRGLFGIGG